MPYPRRKSAYLSTKLGSEHSIQAEFYALLSRVNHPAVALTVAIPNQALALLTYAARLHFKKEGSKAGFPDNVAFYPSPHRSGLLIIEFKRPGEKPRENQHFYLTILAASGHNCFVCDNARDGFDLWLEHYGLKVGF